MPRTARAVVGGVVVFVLVLVAAVAGLVSLVGRSQLDGAWFTYAEEGPFFRDPVTVRAEVLDVDGDVTDGYGWASVDVVFTSPDGEREVAMVDYGEVGPDGEPGVAQLPEVGDVIEVVHERDDPSWVVRADDPMLDEDEGSGPVEPDEDAVAAAQEMVEDSGRLAVGALLLAVLAGAGTLVAVRRAPPTPAPAWADAVPEQGGPPPRPAGPVDRGADRPSAPSAP